MISKFKVTLNKRDLNKTGQNQNNQKKLIKIIGLKFEVFKIKLSKSM